MQIYAQLNLVVRVVAILQETTLAPGIWVIQAWVRSLLAHFETTSLTKLLGPFAGVDTWVASYKREVPNEAPAPPATFQTCPGDDGKTFTVCYSTYSISCYTHLGVFC